VTEFPDRNLEHLRRLVASGRPTYLDGQTPRFLDPEDVAALPVGTVLEDAREDGDSRWLWVRYDSPASLGDAQPLEMVLCVFAQTPKGPDGVGTTVPAVQITGLRIAGALPGTPAAS
jgi:hypothetical protein